MSRARKRTPAPAAPGTDESPPPPPCPVVGIGASAGGLEAFERLFTHMPPDTGMAFVLVQHLDPTHHSLLTELVQRYTRMKVAQVIDGAPIAPDHVYVIPPNRELALHQGRLRLLEPVPRRGLRLPIDQFFRSLAQDQGERAIAVVLSGTGTDGTLGARAVKGEGGMVMVQAPESAVYDGMPQSVIETGLADFVLPPEEMAAHLVRYARDLFPGSAPGEAAPDLAERLAKVLLALRTQTGHDFSQYKPATLARRVERRMVVNRIASLEEYQERLRRDPAETQALFKDLLIGVTGFFRDRDAFAALEAQVLPALFEGRPAGECLRVWVPGCATGEEAYSIALLLRRYLDDAGRGQTVQMFATDIDPEALESARAGRYPESIAADLPPDLLRRYFTRQGNAWQVAKPIREMIVFAAQSLIKDPPFSRLDLISCRNLLIYLQPPLQRRVLGLFNYVLRPGGWLMLGSAESLGNLSSRFTEVDRKWRIYRSLGPDPAVPGVHALTQPGPLVRLGRPPAAGERPKDLREAVRVHTERLLLEHYAPVAITVDEHFDVLYVEGRTSRLLETPSGEATLSLPRLARDGLRTALSQALHRAARLQREVRREDLRVDGGEGARRVHLTVLPVGEPPALRGMLTVVLQDAGAWDAEPAPARPKAPAGSREETLEKELADTREYLQSVVEQLESANEELTSTNEELQSSNEEMQSTNEELETSQEELRSVNEELVTVNAELRSKVNELAKANNDLANLMASAELAILFVDDRLRVQRFTPAATRVLHLVDSDVGRPLGHISSELDYSGLEQDVERLLDTLTPIEKEVQTRAGRWQLLRIRPYRTTNNAIEGAVITVLDIHEQKRGEELKKLTRAIEQSPVSVVITDHRALIEYVNPRFTEITGYSLEEARGQTPRILKSGEHPPEFYRQLWETLTAGRVWRGEFRNRRKNGELYWDASSISPVRNPEGRITHYVSVQEDITARRQMESLLRESEGRYRDLVENIDSGVAVYRAEDGGQDFRFVDFNRAGERIEGIGRDELIGRSLLEAFPGVREMGLFEVLQRVWRTGRPEHLPVSLYQDGRIEGWRDNHIYRLATGEVVAVYEDVTERARAEQGLRREQAALQGILSAASIGIGMVRERRFEWVTDRLLAMVGYGRDELIGRDSRILYPDQAEFERVGRDKYAQIREHGMGEVDTCFRRKDGRLMDVHLSSCALDPADLTQGVVFTAMDTTALRHGERELAHAARILRALSHWHRGAPAAPDEARLCRDLCRILVREGGYRLAWVGYAEDGPEKRVRPVAHEGFDDGYLDSVRISWGDDELGQGPTGTAIRTGQPTVMRDILHDPAFAPWRERALERGYASSLSLPLEVKGRRIGALNVYCSEPDAFDDADVALLGEVAEALGWGIAVLRGRPPA